MPQIQATVYNHHARNDVTLTTNANQHSITIPPKINGLGSSVNGGELLFLALATCYCNDVYREAAKQNIAVKSVEVTVKGGFGDATGSVAENITYDVRAEADASEADIIALLRHTDTVAEVHNTLRLGTTVTLQGIEAISTIDV